MPVSQCTASAFGPYTIAHAHASPATSPPLPGLLAWSSAAAPQYQPPMYPPPRLQLLSASSILQDLLYSHSLSRFLFQPDLHASTPNKRIPVEHQSLDYPIPNSNVSWTSQTIKGSSLFNFHDCLCSGLCHSRYKSLLAVHVGTSLSLLGQPSLRLFLPDSGLGVQKRGLFFLWLRGFTQQRLRPYLWSRASFGESLPSPKSFSCYASLVATPLHKYGALHRSVALAASATTQDGQEQPHRRQAQHMSTAAHRVMDSHHWTYHRFAISASSLAGLSPSFVVFQGSHGARIQR